MARELVLPLAVVAVIGSMLLPVPAAVLDILLIANLALGLTLLLSTLSVTNPLKLSSLPAVLLLLTLFRLALNVSSTRRILSGQSPGSVIEAFGHVVVNGNLVVGLVIFLVISLIQFIVIAKGAERVAEVSARFTLDALPGKQMSIDADVRSGLIDFESARKRREELQIESRFYGALDGAMKFIKGDAIAGLAITAVNLLGGVVAASAGEGQSLSAALGGYAILTIGDGLVAQVPALLNSLAAGIIVTRVNGGNETSLSSDLVREIAELRHVRSVVACFAAALACMPGMPTLPILIFAAALLLSSSFKRTPDPSVPVDKPAALIPRLPPLFEVCFHPADGARLLAQPEFTSAMERIRCRVYERWGLIIPPCEFGTLRGEAGYFEFNFRGVKLGGDRLDSSSDKQTEGIVRVMTASIEAVITETVDDLMTRRLLDTYDSGASELVAAAITSPAGVTQLTELLRELIREGISVRNFDMILQAVAEHSARSASPRFLLEEVRINLARTISSSFSAPDGNLRCLLLDPRLDLLFAAAEREGTVIQPDISEFVAAEIDARRSPGTVLLVSRAARRRIAELTTARGIRVPVIAHEEIAPGVEALEHDRLMLEDEVKVRNVIEELTIQ